MRQTTLLPIVIVATALLGAAAHAATPVEAGKSGNRAPALGTWMPEPGEMFRVHDEVLATAKKAGKAGELVIDRHAQRAYLMVDGKVAIETRVCTGRRGKETPLGNYHISQKVRSGKRSTIYGCKLPYWMRLTDDGIGLHVGDVRDQPSSGGCIRLPVDVAPLVYERMPRGSRVTVVASLAPDQALAVR